MSGVKEIRPKVPPSDFASALAITVFPVPGTSSRRICPSASIQVSTSSVVCSFPIMTFPIFSRIFSSIFSSISRSLRVLLLSLYARDCAVGKDLTWFLSVLKIIFFFTLKTENIFVFYCISIITLLK